MKMTVGALKEILEGLDDNVEVRLMNQPSWPFEYSVRGCVTDDEIRCIKNAGRDEDEDNGARDATKVLYLVEGVQLGYGDKAAWNEF